MGFRRLDRATPPPPAPPRDIEAEISARVRAEIEQLRDAAAAQGRAAGEAQARATLDAAQTRLTQAAAALAQAAAQLAAPLAGKEAELAELATSLAMILAGHIVGAELRAAPAHLARLVNALLAEAAAEQAPRQTLVLRLHPEDDAALRGLLTQPGISHLPDPSIARGGAVVELVWPEGDPLDKAEWDATLPTRLAAIATAMGLPGFAGTGLPGFAGTDLPGFAGTDLPGGAGTDLPGGAGTEPAA